MQILNFVLQSVSGFFTFALLARFAMQWARASFRNPIGQFVITVTDWMVKPARRVIPTAWGHDLASLVLAWLMQVIYLTVIYTISGFLKITAGHVAVVTLLAVIELGSVICNFVFVVVIASVVLSWINPHAPVAPVINAVASPLLRPFQRFIPPIGGMDLSPIALLFAVKLVEIGLVSIKNEMFATMLLR